MVRRVGQTATMPQQSGAKAVAINLTESGEHNREGQGSSPAISVQVLNNNTQSNPPRPRLSPAQVTVSQPPSVQYTYKVKIINPSKKLYLLSDISTMCPANLNRLLNLRVRLMEEFQEHMPRTATFDVDTLKGTAIKYLAGDI